MTADVLQLVRVEYSISRGDVRAIGLERRREDDRAVKPCDDGLLAVVICHPERSEAQRGI